VIVLLFLVAERHDDRRHHAQPERNQLRRAFVGGDFVEDVLLRGVPAGAAKLLGPADANPALLVQRTMPAKIVFAFETGAFEHFAGYFWIEVGAGKFAYLFFESLLLR